MIAAARPRPHPARAARRQRGRRRRLRRRPRAARRAGCALDAAARLRSSRRPWSARTCSWCTRCSPTTSRVSYVAQVGSRAAPDWVTIVEPVVVARGLDPLLGPDPRRLRRRRHAGRNRDRHPEYMPCAVGVWLAVRRLLRLPDRRPAHPFLTLAAPPADGPGPNPLLQNHVLMIDPPAVALPRATSG